VELKRGYTLENDEEHYRARREKVYNFWKIPWEVEKFMMFGFLQCADSFLFVYTFLPLRILGALWGLISRPFRVCFRPTSQTLLKPAEACDLLKGFILVICGALMTYVDTSILYHLIKSQSVIKLYIFYNMLEVGDRLFSSFGQDLIDALFWTSTEKKDRKREHFGVIPHLFSAIIYVCLHALLVLFQATTLNVAINSSNKALLTIMISNNFVELKGSVFKKFDKNNLFQVACSDVRERFHLFVLLFVVVIQTMKEYAWKTEILWLMLPDCAIVFVIECCIDWIKHAFITRFNELQVDVYRDYTLSLAYDMAQTRQKNAYTDHSDLIARRMGFIPLPLGVVMIRVFLTSVRIQSIPSYIVCLLGYLCLSSFRILNNIIILARAAVLIEAHQTERQKQEVASPSSKDSATSPTRPGGLGNGTEKKSVRLSDGVIMGDQSTNLVSTAIFANSTVSMNDVCLNEEMLRVGVKSLEIIGEGETDPLWRSVPNIQAAEIALEQTSEPETLKRAESEPSIPSLVEPQPEDL